MSDQHDTRWVTSSLRGLRPSRRFVDQPVPLPVVEDLVQAARAVGDEAGPAGLNVLVIDDLVTMTELTTVGTFSQGMTGAAVMLVAVQSADDGVSRMKLESRVADAIMLEANRHDLGAAYGYFHEREAQIQVKEMLGVRGRVLVCVGVGYVEDDPEPTGSALERAKRSLDGLTGNRDRHNR